MKFFFIIIISAITLTACHLNPKKITVKSDDGKSTATIDVSGVEKNASEMQNKAEALKKLTPMSMDELKALLPQQLDGVQRSSFDVNSAMGISVGEAEYKKTIPLQLKLVYTIAPVKLVLLITAQAIWLKMNMQSESDNGYTKTIDLMGSKAVETYEKSSNHFTLIYLGNDRVLVSLEGTNISDDELKDVAKNLNLKVS